jgi:hypothetical protein
MAAGDVLLDADGNTILDDDGNVQLSDGAGDDCCCSGTLYRRYKNCAGAYVNLYEPAVDPVANPAYYPKYIIHYASPALGCVWIDAANETTTSPGRILGAENVDFAYQREGFECACDADPCALCKTGTTPFAVLLTFYITGGCCTYDAPDFEPSAILTEIDATIKVVCYLGDGTGSCIWFGDRASIGQMTEWDVANCGGAPPPGWPFPLDIHCSVAMNSTGVGNQVWSVAATINLQGMHGAGETRTVFLGDGTPRSEINFDCLLADSATNTVNFSCDNPNAVDGQAGTWAGGGTCTITPLA